MLSVFRCLPLTVLLTVAGPGAFAQEVPLSNQRLTVASPKAQALQVVHAALRTGDKPRALALTDEALKTFADDAQLRFLRAGLLADLNRTDEAIATLEGLSAQFPELPEPYNSLAAIRARQGRHTDAERLLRQAIAVQGNYLTAKENLADLYVAMALAAYDSAVQLDNHNPVLLTKRDLTLDLQQHLRSLPDTPAAVNPALGSPPTAEHGIATPALKP
jgi:tetratricopeptide (TPR) repeat protein